MSVPEKIIEVLKKQNRLTMEIEESSSWGAQPLKSWGNRFIIIFNSILINRGFYKNPKKNKKF